MATLQQTQKLLDTLDALLKRMHEHIGQLAVEFLGAHSRLEQLERTSHPELAHHVDALDEHFKTEISSLSLRLKRLEDGFN